jgi:hypothetical protein
VHDAPEDVEARVGKSVGGRGVDQWASERPREGDAGEDHEARVAEDAFEPPRVGPRGVAQQEDRGEDVRRERHVEGERVVGVEARVERIERSDDERPVRDAHQGEDDREQTSLARRGGGEGEEGRRDEEEG